MNSKLEEGETRAEASGASAGVTPGEMIRTVGAQLCVHMNDTQEGRVIAQGDLKDGDLGSVCFL